jgi:hypothetical protein
MRAACGKTLPHNSVRVLGRVLMKSDSDLPIAYGLAKQIQLTLLGGL